MTRDAGGNEEVPTEKGFMRDENRMANIWLKQGIDAGWITKPYRTSREGCTRSVSIMFEVE